jgi:hypothetical protein
MLMPQCFGTAAAQWPLFWPEFQYSFMTLVL